MKTIVTHNGPFHADDVFAVAGSRLFYSGEDLRIVRTRDEAEIKAADVVIDVGGVYDPKTNRFDHHQEGGAGARPNSVPYASFGLVWKSYGEKVAFSRDLALELDRKMVEPIDAWDNGFVFSKSVLSERSEYSVSRLMEIFLPTWREDAGSMDRKFEEAVSFAEKIILREVEQATARAAASVEVERSYEASSDRRIIVLLSHFPFQDVLIAHPEPLFVVYPSTDNIFWRVKAVRKKVEGFENRKDLPLAWAGKRGRELAKITGVKDAVFCHNKLFLAVADSKEGAITLAKKALD